MLAEVHEEVRSAWQGVHGKAVAASGRDSLRIELIHIHPIEILLQPHARLHLLERSDRHILGVRLPVNLLQSGLRASLVQVLLLLWLRALPFW